MSLSMRRQDWDRLIADHPELLHDGNPRDYWQYDPLAVASARLAAEFRIHVLRPIGSWAFDTWSAFAGEVGTSHLGTAWRRLRRKARDTP